MTTLRIVGAMMAGLATVVAMLSSVDAQQSSSAQAKELLALTRGEEIGKQMAIILARQFFLALRTTNPSLPNEALVIVEQVTVDLLNERANEYFDRLVPLYERYFTAADLDELLRFYRTETGRKAIRVMPLLLQETIPIAEAWARSLRPEIDRRIREQLAAKGYTT